MASLSFRELDVTFAVTKQQAATSIDHIHLRTTEIVPMLMLADEAALHLRPCLSIMCFAGLFKMLPRLCECPQAGPVRLRDSGCLLSSVSCVIRDDCHTTALQAARSLLLWWAHGGGTGVRIRAWPLRGTRGGQRARRRLGPGTKRACCFPTEIGAPPPPPPCWHEPNVVHFVTSAAGPSDTY